MLKLKLPARPRLSAYVGLPVLILGLVALCNLTHGQTDEPKEDIAFPVELKPYTLTVVDEQAKPLANISVEAAGVRCEEDPGSWYGWPTPNAGKNNRLVTDADGKITVLYPTKFGPQSGLVTTNKIDFRFNHADFVAASLEVDPREPGVEHTLIAGCPVEFSAIDDRDTPIDKFGVLMAGRGRNAEWVLEDGKVRSRGIPDGSWQTMLIAPDSNGETLFSGILPTRFAKGRPVTIRNIKLATGVRLTGALADVVPRPVTDGSVVAWCLPKPRGEVYGNQDPSLAWCDVAEIAADGSFTFPSLPPTGTVQLIARCRGWLIVSQRVEGRKDGRVQGIQVDLDSAEIIDKQLSVMLPMQVAGSLEVIVSKPDGTPLAGAEVSTWPNQIFDKGGSTLVGQGFPSVALIENQIAGRGSALPESFYAKQMQKSPYSAVTDEQGRAVLYDIPIASQEAMMVGHKEFELKAPEAAQRAFTSIDYVLENENRKTVEIAMVPLQPPPKIAN